MKPISTWEDQKVRKLKVKMQGQIPTIIDEQIKYLRLGAFEVQLYSKSNGKKASEMILHSKLKTGSWPNISKILEKIHFFQSRVPQLSIQLFSDEKGQLDDSHDKGAIFDELDIKLTSSYNCTQSQFQLEQFLEEEQSERI